jgi:hypothetical protein
LDSCFADHGGHPSGLIVGEHLSSFKLHVAALHLPLVDGRPIAMNAMLADSHCENMYAIVLEALDVALLTGLCREAALARLASSSSENVSTATAAESAAGSSRLNILTSSRLTPAAWVTQSEPATVTAGDGTHG